MPQPHVPTQMESHRSFHARSGSIKLYGDIDCEGHLAIDEETLSPEPNAPVILTCTECGFATSVSRALIDPDFRTRRLLEISNLPEEFRDKPYDNEFNPQAIKAAEKYLKGEAPPPIFHGATGTGKTHLMTRIGVGLCKQNKVVKYWDLTSLLRKERALIGDPKNPSHTDKLRPVDAACKAEILILDDLGAERSTDWTVEQLQTIVDHRYQAGKHTIAATNIAPMEWPEVFGERVTSRLGGGNNMIEMVGDDRRLQLQLAS